MRERSEWIWEKNKTKQYPKAVCPEVSVKSRQEGWLSLKGQWPCDIVGPYNLTAGYIDEHSGIPSFKKILCKKYKIDKPGSNAVHYKIDINIKKDPIHGSFNTTLSTPSTPVKQEVITQRGLRERITYTSRFPLGKEGSENISGPHSFLNGAQWH